MDSDRERQAASFVSGLILGAVIGAGVTLLTMPQSGRRTRRRLKRVAGRVQSSTTDRFDDVAAELREGVEDAIRGARARLGR